MHVYLDAGNFFQHPLEKKLSREYLEIAVTFSACILPTNLMLSLIHQVDAFTRTQQVNSSVSDSDSYLGGARFEC